MFKNVATKIALFAFDTTTGAPKTGDAANITAYVSKDYGATTVLADTSATEQDATNAKGWYLFDVAQAEANADALLFTAKSTTANVSIVGQYIFTQPNRFTSMVIDAAGLVDANAVKVGPTGAGTAQTAKDLGASSTQTGDSFARLGAPAGASHAADIAAVKVDTAAVKVQTDKLTFTVANQVDSNVIDWKGAAAPAMTGDAFARLGAPAGASVSADVAAVLAKTPDAAHFTSARGDKLDDLDATISSRLASAGYTAPDNASVTAIKAKTDNLPSDPADESLIIAATDAIMGRLGAPAGASVSADVAGVKTDTAAIKLKTDNLPAAPAAVNDIPTAADNASATWEEDLSGHATAGTAGKALSDAGAAGDPWSTALPGSYGPGTAGKIVGTNLDATVSSRSSYAGGDTAGTTTVLARLSATRAGYLDNLSGGAVALEASVQALITTIGAAAAGVATAVWNAATRLLTAGTNIVLTKGTGVIGFNDLSAAQVNAEADTALADAGVTSARQAHLDADVSSRLPTSTYVAPDNAGIGVAEAAAASAATDASTLVGRLTSVRAAKLDNLDAAVSSVPTAAQNADKLLGRSIAGGVDGGHVVRDALRPLRNRTDILSGELHVYEEDGVTLAWSAPITTAPGDPLASVSPA